MTFPVGATIDPQLTVAMEDDTLAGYIRKGETTPLPSGVTTTLTSNRPSVVAVSGTSLKAAGDAYRSQLAQTMQALDLDLTAAGVDTVAPVIAKLVDDEAGLRASLVDISDKSDRVAAVVGQAVR